MEFLTLQAQILRALVNSRQRPVNGSENIVLIDPSSGKMNYDFASR